MVTFKEIVLRLMPKKMFGQVIFVPSMEGLKIYRVFLVIFANSTFRCNYNIRRSTIEVHKTIFFRCLYLTIL